MSAEGLQDRLAGRLARGRAMAEARMVSTCTVRRQTGEMDQDESDGFEVPVWAVVYEGPMRLRGARSGMGYRTEDTPAGERVLGVPEVHLPVDAYAAADGDLVDVTAGERAGTVWRVVNSDAADQQTALRLPVEAADRPEEWA